MATAKTTKSTTAKKSSKAAPQEKAQHTPNSFTEIDLTGQDGNLQMVDKLKLLYHLQQTDSQIDRIHLLRGELPLEVQDLEDEIQGFKVKITKIQAEIKEIEKDITAQKHKAEEARNSVARYTSQQDNVKNNREYDSLSKEIEFQKLEAELADKRVKEFTSNMKDKKEQLENTKIILSDRENDLVQKKQELENIEAETAVEEKQLMETVGKIESMIDNYTLSAYHKVRGNARNGLAVVTVQRDACGGCFNHIPPQRKIDIRMSKKIIVCEYCGRILVDESFAKLDEQ